MYLHYEHNKPVQALVKKRWDFASTEYTGISYMLTPKYAADGFYVDNDKIDIIEHVRKYVEARHVGFGERAEEEMGSFVSAMTTMTGSRKETQICTCVPRK